jgi:hypothetical protein
MKVLELFAGTRCISKAFEKHGHETYSVEWNKKFKDITLYEDINNLTIEKIYEICGGKPDVVWASPDCATYSVAGLRYHRRKIDGKFYAFSEYAQFCDITNNHLMSLIKTLNPKLFFIENPRGIMRKMDFVKGIPRYTITYCQYGDTRQKPTDIWTNHPNPNFKPPCKPGSKCHEAAPRGSKSGTQNLSNSIERSKIPEKLCDYIVKISEEII